MLVQPLPIPIGLSILFFEIFHPIRISLGWALVWLTGVTLSHQFARKQLLTNGRLNIKPTCLKCDN